MKTNMIDLEIRDKGAMENLVTHHLNHLPLNEKPVPLKDEFLDVHLFLVKQTTP